MEQTTIGSIVDAGTSSRGILAFIEPLISLGGSVTFDSEDIIFSEGSDVLSFLRSLAEIEEQRHRVGIQRAREDGRLGKRSRFTNVELAAIREQFEKSTNKAALARRFGISRQHLYRIVKVDTCHQYKMRLQFKEAEPRKQMTLEELHECEIRAITRKEAEEVIVKYEWLGNVRNGSSNFYGLITPFGEIAGVAVFGKGGGSNSSKVCGDEYKDRAICLERGTCVHWAHPHAGSYFLSKVCKLAHKEHGWNIFLAYSDIEAGEIGTLYQSCSWQFLGSGNGRVGSVCYHYEAEHKPSGIVYSERNIRSYYKKAAADERHLWSWEYLKESKDWEVRKVLDRSRYIHFEGSRTERKRLQRALKYQVLPYPKR